MESACGCSARVWLRCVTGDSTVQWLAAAPCNIEAIKGGVSLPKRRTIGEPNAATVLQSAPLPARRALQSAPRQLARTATGRLFFANLSRRLLLRMFQIGSLYSFD